MKSINKFFPKPTFQLFALLGAGLLLTACSGSTEPATTPTAAAPAVSESVTSAEEDTIIDTPPVPTAAATSSEVASNPVEAVSTTNPTATAQAYPTRKPASTYADLQVVTLLPRDAIPAIDNPKFLSAAEADQFYDSDELVMGVSFNGDSRAYSAPFLSSHEIVNDTVGGVKIAVTW